MRRGPKLDLLLPPLRKVGIEREEGDALCPRLQDLAQRVERDEQGDFEQLGDADGERGREARRTGDENDERVDEHAVQRVEHVGDGLVRLADGVERQRHRQRHPPHLRAVMAHRELFELRREAEEGLSVQRAERHRRVVDVDQQHRQRVEDREERVEREVVKAAR
eukprot:6175201-Pleurochrysis_carterae.AAC.1